MSGWAVKEVSHEEYAVLAAKTLRHAAFSPATMAPPIDLGMIVDDATGIAYVPRRDTK